MFQIIYFLATLAAFWMDYHVLAAFMIGTIVSAVLVLALVEHQFNKRGMQFDTAFDLWEIITPKWMH